MKRSCVAIFLAALVTVAACGVAATPTPTALSNTQVLATAAAVGATVTARAGAPGAGASPGAVPSALPGGLPMPPVNAQITPSLPPLANTAGSPYSFDQYVAQVRARGVDAKPLAREYRVPYFTVVGSTLEAAGEQVLVWVYANPEAREVDSRKISADGRVVAGEERPWRATPHFYSRGNLIVQFVSDNEELASQLKQALEAM